MLSPTSIRLEVFTRKLYEEFEEISLLCGSWISYDDLPSEVIFEGREYYKDSYESLMEGGLAFYRRRYGTVTCVLRGV